MTVVDASALLELLLRSENGQRVEERVFRRNETLQAPALIDLEVAQVLRRYVARGEMTPHRARSALAIVAAFPMDRYTHEALIDRIWELRDNLTAYDAAYVALAEGLRVPLVTCDARLAGAPGIRADVEVLG